MRRIVLLQEGLGNQMFAYAFYLAMKKKYSDTAVSAYLFHRWSPHNGLEIDRLFGIDLEEKPMINFIVRVYRKLFYLSKKNNYGVFFRYILKFLYQLHLGLCTEKVDILYDENSYIWKPNYKIYWATWVSEKWFLSVEKEIRNCYTFNIEFLQQKTRDLLENPYFTQANSVGIHVRRGDYLNTPLDVCDVEYYRKAIYLLSSKIDDPYFYIFSNDVDWCKINLIPPPLNGRVLFVDWNKGLDSWQDMFLMSECKHNIIANSTFSWWAAWLNKHADKIVICPTQFSKGKNFVNIWPESWIKI